MWSILKTLSNSLLRFSEWTTQSKRSTYILKRLRPTRLNKLSASHPRKQKRTTYYYELVENTDVKRKPLLDLVLIKDVPGVGMFGEKIQENCYIAYRDLLLPKLAVYAGSHEAQNILRSTDEKHYSSKFSKIVQNHLAGQAVPIILSYETKWKLDRWHVKFALRRAGILTNEDCITLPDKEISGPDPEVENKDFLIKLTMNKAETFLVRCRIYHWSAMDPSINHKKFDIYSESEPLFSEDKEKVESAIKTEMEIKKRAKGSQFMK